MTVCSSRKIISLWGIYCDHWVYDGLRDAIALCGPPSVGMLVQLSKLAVRADITQVVRPLIGRSSVVW